MLSHTRSRFLKMDLFDLAVTTFLGSILEVSHVTMITIIT